MKIYSERFKTELEFDDNLVIKMPWGLPGFPESQRFCILELDDKDSPFKWLHDVDNTSIALLITDPYLFYPDYSPTINPNALAQIGIKVIEKELTLFTIVKVARGGGEAFTNLRAPVVVNAETKVARQIILENDEYSVKTALFLPQEESQLAVNS